MCANRLIFAEKLTRDLHLYRPGRGNQLSFEHLFFPFRGKLSGMNWKLNICLKVAAELLLGGINAILAWVTDACRNPNLNIKIRCKSNQCLVFYPILGTYCATRLT
jgi:hypothetical protein